MIISPKHAAWLSHALYLQIIYIQVWSSLVWFLSLTPQLTEKKKKTNSHFHLYPRAHRFGWYEHALWLMFVESLLPAKILIVISCLCCRLTIIFFVAGALKTIQQFFGSLLCLVRLLMLNHQEGTPCLICQANPAFEPGSMRMLKWHETSCFVWSSVWIVLCLAHDSFHYICPYE